MDNLNFKIYQNHITNLLDFTCICLFCFSLPEEEDQENTCRSPPTREWTPGACGNAPTREWTPVPVNSHLAEFNRNVPTGSLAGLKLSGKDSSKRSVVMRYT